MRIAAFERRAQLARLVAAMRKHRIKGFRFDIWESEDEYRPIGPRHFPPVEPPQIEGPAKAGEQKILWRGGTGAGAGAGRSASPKTLAEIARMIAVELSQTCLSQWARSPAYLRRFQDVAKRNRIELADYPRARYARTRTVLRLYVERGELAVRMEIDATYGACRLRAFDCSNDWPIEIA
jgi:hypothetical protein